MRVAVIRGPNLNPWELRNLVGAADEMVAIGSRAGSFVGHGLPLRHVGLPSPADAVLRLPPMARGAVGRLAGNLDHLLGLERALRGFDIAHSAELATGYSAQAVAARRGGAVRRVVATVWENIPVYPPENALVARRVAAVAAGLDRALAVTADARLHLELAGMPADRIELAPMGVDVERFAPREAGTGAGGPLRVLSVTRLVHEKGVEDLVVAAHVLGRRSIAIELTFAGEGPLRGALESLAARLGVPVRFAGTVPYEEIPALFRAADVFVLASAPRTTWREQFGFAVVEAMASGLPVLAGRSGSLDEVVGDPDQLVPPHHVRDLAAALGALADPALREARGARNRRWALERYDHRRAVEAVRGFYERALTTRPR